MKRMLLLLGLVSLLCACSSPPTGRTMNTAPAETQTGLERSMFYQNSWAVVIGINRYEEFPSLEYAVNDAKAVEARFRTMGFEVISLQDEYATRENILQLLKYELPEIVGPQDSLVIFYAGHGAAGLLPTGHEVGFIIPSDGRSMVDGRRVEIIGGRISVDNYETFPERTNFISVDDIRAISDTVRAKHILYIIDGCYSGFLDPAAYSRLRPSERIGQGVDGSSRGIALDSDDSTQPVQTSTPAQAFDPNDPKSYLQVITARDTVQVLTAGSSGEVVYEKSGHGVFTYYLLKALDGAADIAEGTRKFNDCAVTLSELGKYVKEKVPGASNFSQSPLFNRISGEGDFVFIPPICRPIDPIDMQPPVSDSAWMGTDAYRGPESNEYEEPTQVLVDNENYLYVLDEELEQIFKFDPQGNYLPNQFGKMEASDKYAPNALALDYQGNVWVYYAWQGKKRKNTPSPPGQIAVYSDSGVPQVNWSGTIEAVTSCFRDDGSEVSFPATGLLALDFEENLIVLDQDSGAMMKCDRNGKLIHEWGQYEEHEIIDNLFAYKTVSNPQGLAVDMFGYIYATDTDNHGIQKYYDGEWVLGWPNVKGDNPQFFDTPHGLTVDRRLHVYVADTENHRIKKYTSGAEKLLAYWGKGHGKKGSKYGEFKEPQSVAVNSNSTIIYVADTGNKRVQRFLIQR